MSLGFEPRSPDPEIHPAVVSARSSTPWLVWAGLAFGYVSAVFACESVTVAS